MTFLSLVQIKVRTNTTEREGERGKLPYLPAGGLLACSPPASRQDGGGGGGGNVWWAADLLRRMLLTPEKWASKVAAGLGLRVATRDAGLRSRERQTAECTCKF